VSVLVLTDHAGCLGGNHPETFVFPSSLVDHDGFFDPADPSGQWSGRVSLVRCGLAGPERFHLLRGIGFHDRELGDIVVPAADGSFSSDLTSVPGFLTWLVPKTGQHLPAALLHDGLIGTPEYQSLTPVDRIAADRVFREAMAALGVSRMRRWLVWTGVTLATIWGLRHQYRRYRLASLVLFAIVGFCGVNATLDLFDLGVKLPWMGDRPGWLELLTGAAAAATCGLLGGALFYPRFWRAGMILTLALALLFHVVLAVLVVRGVFWAADRAVGPVRARRWVVPVFFVAAAGVTAWAIVSR